ncbi:MAG TPA: hypothetical protein VLH39_07595, partial [Magnetospirillaceae bacterium]|nr:hypothetical protein [Magnetospirillaceae bacterium]
AQYADAFRGPLRVSVYLGPPVPQVPPAVTVEFQAGPGEREEYRLTTPAPENLALLTLRIEAGGEILELEAPVR